jgi:predicted lactoylglutathione lyase
MISYVTLGTNDLEKSAKFYDSLLKGLGADRAFTTETLIAWSFGEGSAMLTVTRPFDGNPATVGNGVMVALKVKNSETVEMLHAKALELGAKNEGAPGLRGNSFYAGYFRDPDGNKLNFFCYQ